MTELIDFKAMWDRLVLFWKENLLAVIFCGISFAFGDRFGMPITG